jgi:5S rRNA maturation endonuclease (ribonuclease M5)
MAFWAYWWNTLSNILIIVEGPTDRAFIDSIAERLNISCKVICMRGNEPKKADRWLRIWRKTYGFCKVIILKDTHRGDIDTSYLIGKVMKVANQFKDIKVHIIQVKRSIESWILAGLSVKNPENLLNPEEELKNLIQRKGKHYSKSIDVYRKLALEVDIELAKSKSETFRNFLECLKDC